MKDTLNEQIKYWAEEIKQSNRNAFDELFRKLYAGLVCFAKGYVQDKDLAGDIVQDAFVVLWQKRRNINPEHSLKAYLYTMVRNRALNEIRNRSGTVRLELEHSNLPVTEPDQHIQENLHDEIAKKFDTWIEELPDRQREAFKLSRYEGLDHDEIADVMGISGKTVNNHLVAALGYLRSCYETYQKEVNRMKND